MPIIADSVVGLPLYSHIIHAYIYRVSHIYSTFSQSPTQQHEQIEIIDARNNALIHWLEIGTTIQRLEFNMISSTVQFVRMLLCSMHFASAQYKQFLVVRCFETDNLGSTFGNGDNN